MNIKELKEYLEKQDKNKYIDLNDLVFPLVDVFKLGEIRGRRNLIKDIDKKFKLGVFDEKD